MKKIITVLLCMALLCTSLSCGKKEDTKKNEETVAPAEDTAAEEEPYTLISEEDILGQWSVTLDLENSLSILGYTTADLFGDSSPEEVGCTAALELIMNYERDGKGVLILTGEQIDSFFLDVYTAFYGYISDYSVATEMYDMTKEELDKNAYEEYEVSTWPEAMEKELEFLKTQASENPTEDSLSTYTYTIDREKLTVIYEADSTVEIYNMKDSKLVCITSDNTNGDPAVYTYEKVQ